MNDVHDRLVEKHETLTPLGAQSVSYVVFCVSPDKEMNFRDWSKATGREVDTGMGIKCVIGTWHGETEHSCYIASEAAWAAIKSDPAGWVANQVEAVMLEPANRDGSRDAYRVPLAKASDAWGTPEYLGTWRATGAKDALARDGWTFDPLTRTYFVIDPAGSVG